MILEVANKKEFDAWLHEAVEEVRTYYGEHLSRNITIEKLVKSTIKLKKTQIEVEPTDKISEIIKRLTGNESVTIEPYIPQDENDSNQNTFSSRLHRKEGSQVITERYLYCLSADTDELEPKKEIADYDIQDGDLLLLAVYTKIEPDPSLYQAALFRDLYDFRRIVRSQNDINESPGLLFRFPPLPKGITSALQASIIVGSEFHAPGFRRVEAFLLYTDEDEAIASYIRYNFAELDRMTGSHLNLYTIEQPTKIKGVSARQYWKAKLEKNKYEFMHLMGWTQFKPYDKSQAYIIAESLGIYPDALPCVVFFGAINSNEKVVVTISTEVSVFFRELSSIVLRTFEKNFKNKDKSLASFGRLQGVSFEQFKENFLKNWESAQKLRKLRKSKTFVFNGKTVFVNKPSGKVELTDFQNNETNNCIDHRLLAQRINHGVREGRRGFSCFSLRALRALCSLIIRDQYKGDK